MTSTLSTFIIIAGTAPPAPEKPGLSGMLWQLAPFIAIIAVFFWFMSRSQKKRDAQRRQMLDDIKVKDDVVTIGGIHGRVVQIKGDEFVLRVDPEKDIKITIARTGISRKKGQPQEADQAR